MRFGYLGNAKPTTFITRENHLPTPTGFCFGNGESLQKITKKEQFPQLKT